jgi:CheY-specific phosphatase CheX
MPQEVTSLLEELEKMLQDSVSDAFSTMLNLTVQPQPPAPFAPTDQLIAAAVGFAGEVTGVVYIYCTDRFGCQIASRMLGMPEAEIDGQEMVNDVMGELGNMIVGKIKSQLCDIGHTCVLTIPSILRGQNFCVHPMSSTTNRKLGFAAEGHAFVTEIIIKAGS